MIGVTYPEGSTCTCSDGNKTLKAKDTSGQALFLIPYAATWTVTAIDGELNVSKSVSISSFNEVVTTEIFFTKYLFNGGATVPWKKLKMGRITTLSEFNINTNYYNVHESQIGIGTKLSMTITYPTQGNIATTELIDMAPYSTLKIDANTWENSGNTSSVQYAIAVTNVTGDNVWYSNAAVKSGVIAATGARTISLDVSALTGSFYVAIWAGNDEAGYQFDNIRLETQRS